MPPDETRLALPLALLALALLVPSGAAGRVPIQGGIGNRASPSSAISLFQALEPSGSVHIPWDLNADATQEAEVRGYLTAAPARPALALIEPFPPRPAAARTGADVPPPQD